MRAGLGIAAALMLAGCMGSDGTQQGVGFNDYQGYLAEREAALRGAPAAARPIAPATAQAIAPPPVASAPLSALAPAASVPAATPMVDPMTAPTSIAPSSIAPFPDVPMPAPEATVSDDPAAIGAAALAAIGASPVAVPPPALAAAPAPMAVPVPAAPTSASRAGLGPNLAAYALAAQNRLGQPVWTRGGLTLANHERACAKFTTTDQAQTEFLRRGGPERDPGNLDPDGDGFACSWDPTPFQAVRDQ